MSVDVVTLGEAMLRLSVPRGTRLSEATALEVTIGGAESNVAVALARMGCPTAWVSALPDGPLGRNVLENLAQHGVDTRFVVMVPDSRMGLYFVEPGSAPRPTRVVYDREDSAVSRLRSDDVPWRVVESARAVHLTGITPALSDGLRDLSLEFVERARSSGVAVCLDVNYRAKLWGREEARDVLLRLCREATLVILTAEDARDVFGLSGSDHELLDRAHEMFGSEYVALTLGNRGALLADGRQVVEQPGTDAVVVDRMGSGDAFAAGLVQGLVNGEVVGALPTASAMAVLKLGVSGDHLSADPDDLAAIMADPGREVHR